MTKLAKLTAARLWMVILGILAIGIVAEYLHQSPPHPNTLLGKVWAMVAR